MISAFFFGLYAGFVIGLCCAVIVGVMTHKPYEEAR